MDVGDVGLPESGPSTEPVDELGDRFDRYIDGDDRDEKLRQAVASRQISTFRFSLFTFLTGGPKRSFMEDREIALITLLVFGHRIE